MYSPVGMMESLVKDDIVGVLTRIAVALEQIASAKEVEKQEEHKVAVRTEFPWHRVSMRCRERLKKAVVHDVYNDFRGYKWPLSCEDLMAIGREKLLEVRDFGTTSASEIIPFLEERGFHNWDAT